MAEQLWKGRFSKAVDSRVNDFNSSIRFDQRMIAQDMRGSGVHAAMLAKQGIISEKDCEGRMDLRALPIFEFNRVRGKARSFLLASEL